MLTQKPLTNVHTRVIHLLVAALALFSFAMSAMISRSVFERIPHLEDEMAYLWEARTIAGGNFVIPTPEPRLAYWQPFVVDEGGSRFGKYTPGYPLQLALGVLLGQEWIINAFFAALTVAVVYRLGREIYGEEVGAVGAALVAFSPAALLLNGSLMGHSAALFWATLFCYGYWRIERGKRRRAAWGVLAGAALGMVFITRPATALALAIPFVAWSGIRLARVMLTRHLSAPDSSIQPHPPTPSPYGEGELSTVQRGEVDSPLTEGEGQGVRLAWGILAPLLALSFVTILIALLVPLYNYQATGDARANLYRFVWEYDQIGYGQGYGRNGHTLEKGVRHARFDLSLTAADLFGWQLEPLTDGSGVVRPELQDHFVNQGDYYPATGVSWILLPLAFIIIYRKRSIWVFAWAALGLAWLALPFLITGSTVTDDSLIRNPQMAWITVIGLVIWLCAPLLVLRETVRSWTWLLTATALALIIVQLTYWIGSQRYSTRYFYEGLAAAALLSAIPIVWLAQRTNRLIVYGIFAAVLGVAFATYSLPRIGVLHGFNLLNRQIVDAVEARRDDGRDVLVIITGENVRWRSYGALMSQTSPYLDSPIVAARVSSSIPREQVIAMFPNRQIIEMEAEENVAWFVDEAPP